MFDNGKSQSLLGGVSVTEISPFAWHVQRIRRTGAEAPVLLGFVQQFGDVFEAMDVTLPLERTYVPSAVSAVASITGGTVTQ